jgi:hypothetical protein
MIGDKSSYKETPCIDSPTDRCPGIYSYLSGAVRLLVSSIKVEVKKKHNSNGWNFSCFAAHLMEQDLF